MSKERKYGRKISNQTNNLYRTEINKLIRAHYSPGARTDFPGYCYLVSSDSGITSACMIYYPNGTCSGLYDLFTFWEISDNTRKRCQIES